ncbi:hypothetical protein H5410_021917 [Solanum commersonii]|uniref:Uncharacterized protein n=1 Tax=Solanum commersonii TaxID=4109 RepID=A0A9J5ZGM5_SOLCO|nr:hypothetical protein H5410_021917 [Solanum commersonii]
MPNIEIHCLKVIFEYGLISRNSLNFKFVGNSYQLCDVAKNHFLTRLVECVVNFYARWTKRVYATEE